MDSFSSRINLHEKYDYPDILGAVSTMLSGYPERAKHLFWQERGKRLASQYAALLQDYEALSEGGKNFA